MQILRRPFDRLLPVLAALSVFLSAPGFAQEVDPDAVASLRRMTDYLTAMKQFRLETDTTIEAVLANGQKLQFGHRVALVVQRPNKVRAERVGELIAQTFYYDGKSLSVNLPQERYHATVAAPPTIDAMLDFARDKLGVIAPASDMVYSNALDRLTDGLTAAYFVGPAIVGGIHCTHLAFRNAEVDWQIWIQDGDKPLPRKFIVTSKKMPQSPQFEVLMSKWDIAPRLTDGMFRFTPPKGSRPIEFTPTAVIR